MTVRIGVAGLGYRGPNREPLQERLDASRRDGHA
jgi:hypothetical protein